MTEGVFQRALVQRRRCIAPRAQTIACLCGLILLGVSADPAHAQGASTNAQELRSLMSLDLAALGRLQVYSASRELTSIEQSPSVVTLINAEEIRRRGYKNLKDVLDRVPGFFNSPDAALSLIASRGFVQNPNNNFLLLIDGHSINAVADEGLNNAHLLPHLHQVKRIEILRGPGSTLWGGDAANGIFNIVTYDGSDLAGIGQPFSEVLIDHEFGRPRELVSFLGGARLGDSGDIMISANVSRSRADFLPIYEITDAGPRLRNIEYKHEAWRPSHEVQVKARWKDLRVNARSSRHNGYYRSITPRRDDESRRFDFDFIELGMAPQLGPRLSLDASVHYNRSDTPLRTTGDDGSIIEGFDNGYTETGLTAVLTSGEPGSHRIKLGTQITRRNFDGNYFYTPGNFRFESLVGIENATGVFVEGEYSGIENWTFTLGARHQRNDFRQEGSAMLYRWAAIWSPAQRWSFKYLYNTGDVRASLGRSRGTPDNPLVIDRPNYTAGPVAEVGPERPQLAFSHDLQALYADDRLRATLTLFRQDIKQYIVRAFPFPTGQVTSDGIPIWKREINAGDLRAHGLELEGEYRPVPDWLIYSNYSRALNRARETQLVTSGGTALDLVTTTTYFAPDGRVTGVPEHLWNFGVDWSPTATSTVNLHYRGWSDMWGRTRATSLPFKHYGPQHYVDLTQTWRRALGQSIDVQVYIKNAFDNKAPTPQAPRLGEIPGLGRELGVSLTVRL